MLNHILLHASDSVVTALAMLSKGDRMTVNVGDEAIDLTLSSDIPYAHKIAVRRLAIGDPITKYGQVIGIASQAIAPGDWVHVHNVDSARARGDVA